MPIVNFQIPKGLWYANSTEVPPQHCLELINMIPKVTGVECRKGQTVYDYSKKYTYIAPYSVFNKLILYADDNSISLLDLDEDTIEVVIPSKSLDATPIAYLETNNGVIFFYGNSMPYFFNYNYTTEAWENVVITFELRNPETDELEPLPFENFDGATRYRERLYFYKIGENALYYTKPLLYGGEIQKYDITQVFNSKGNLINLNVLGYSAGAGVQSHLIASYNTGDVLVLNGNNPADITGEFWQAVSSIQTHVKLYNSSIQYGTSLFILSSEGIIDLSIALNDNSINRAKYMSLPLQDSIIPYETYKIYSYKNYICLSAPNLQYGYYWNTDTQGFFKVSGLLIDTTAYIQDRLFYIDTAGILYEGFNNVCDETLLNGEIVKNPINYEYVTSFENNNSDNWKKANLISIDSYQESGSATFSSLVLTDYNYDITDTHTNLLPSFSAYIPRWQDWSTWNECNELVWSSKTVSSTVYTIKLSTQGVGRTVAIRIYGQSLNIELFSFGVLQLEYEEASL